MNKVRSRFVYLLIIEIENKEDEFDLEESLITKPR